MLMNQDFFKINFLPEHTFAFQRETCIGPEHSKYRLTMLFCISMDELDKRKFLIIGKSKNSCCLKNIKLIIEYQYNQKERTTSGILGKYFKEFDNDFKFLCCINNSYYKYQI